MLKIGSGELIVILLVALIVFGPSKLPALGKTMGQAMGYIKRQIKEIEFEANLTSEPKPRESVPVVAAIQKTTAVSQELNPVDRQIPSTASTSVPLEKPSDMPEAKNSEMKI